MPSHALPRLSPRYSLASRQAVRDEQRNAPNDEERGPPDDDEVLETDFDPAERERGKSQAEEHETQGRHGEENLQPPFRDHAGDRAGHARYGHAQRPCFGELPVQNEADENEGAFEHEGKAREQE